jgi:hypothetical protein
MWQALKALWGKIAGQAPPVPAAAPTRKPVPSLPQEAKPPLRNNSSTRATTPVPQPPAQPATPRDPLSRLADSASTPPNKAWDAFSAIAAAEDTRKKEASGLESGQSAGDPTDDFLQKLVGKRPAPSEETPEEETPEPEPTAAAPQPPEEPPAAEPAATSASEPTLEIPTPTVEVAQIGGESAVAIPAQEKPTDSPPEFSQEFPQAVQTSLGPARPTPTAESINSFGAKSDIGSRISSIASSTDSGRAVSSISMARLHQPE